MVNDEQTRDPGHERHMARALALAERGRGRTSPNPMVGAVIVDADGVVVGRGAHEAAGGPHAEVAALADAGDRARGATLYCTLEPCSHTGRTGPCAPRVVAAGVRRAVIAIEDPNPMVAGRGLSYLKDNGVEVVLGVMRDEAERLNRPFFTFISRQRPFVTLKAAVSLDGMVAARRGARTPITGAEANSLTHVGRAETDAIAIGSETAIVDDPLLTARGVYRDRPLTRVIFDRRLRTPAQARIFSTLDAGPVVIVTATGVDRSRADELSRAGAQIEFVEMPNAGVADGAKFLATALSALARRKIMAMTLEGGPTLQQAFWRAGLVDRVELLVSPHAIGTNGVEWGGLPGGSVAFLDELSASPVGADVRIEGYVHRAG
jgi:diaminohydroxyphosphoribosylaminopyrimidine deaminase/5-amino-6-(5-phosphoribosylamino)uracil reductase